ncbi:hypothetical protein TRFO_25572 [Tritrichomonas foetus]|uniref:Uncharacterized protein n=1 Tax=Tritrichomonas foetus TaxID=1144522 RepID=A0A1J4K9Y7_9EUKA|nr:hypothetical protein TRFO_25572 [Tritrichomonas foetus]|eukprot:OHT06454.1 hypothetical protein TRFO_25572 [Tritrichomonas foetus]
MFRFNSQTQSCKETENALEKDDVTFEKLLKCSDLSNAYRSNNPKLLAYLLTPEHIKEIFQLLMKTKERKIHKDIVGLYTTSNMSLHRCFIDSLELTEFAFESIDESSGNANQYAAGTMSRFLSRVMDSWPSEIHEVFSLSPKLYNLIINNIDNKIVYYPIYDLITSSQYPIGEFMWNLYRSLSGDNDSHAPRICYNSRKMENLPHFDLSNSSDDKTKHKVTSIIELLISYFKTNENASNVRDFRKIVLNYIVKIKDTPNFIPEYYSLAKVVGYDKVLQDFAISSIKSKVEAGNYVDTEMSLCLSYLTICVKNLDLENALYLTCSLVNEKVPHFVLLSLLDLVTEIFNQDVEWFDQYLATLSKLIALTWNLYHESNPTITAFLIQFGILLPEDMQMEVNKNEKYHDAVTCWKRDTQIVWTEEIHFTTDFDFEKQFYNLDEINKHRWGQEKFEEPPEKPAPSENANEDTPAEETPAEESPEQPVEAEQNAEASTEQPPEN